MFKRSGFSIAMGNASDEVKAQAAAVAASSMTKVSPRQWKLSYLVRQSWQVRCEPPSGQHRDPAGSASVGAPRGGVDDGSGDRRAGPFRVSLSGGSTPKTLYGLLASDGFRDRFPWQRVSWYWGDERFVPYDHPESNFRMTRELDARQSPGAAREHSSHAGRRHSR